MICIGLSLVKMISKSGLPARYSLNARSITLVADARQYSTSMPDLALNVLMALSAASDSSEP
jgi:hypothetical protein